MVCKTLAENLCWFHCSFHGEDVLLCCGCIFQVARDNLIISTSTDQTISVLCHLFFIQSPTTIGIRQWSIIIIYIKWFSTLHEGEWSETYQIFPLSFIVQWVSRMFYQNIQTGYESRTRRIWWCYSVWTTDLATSFEATKLPHMLLLTDHLVHCFYKQKFTPCYIISH